jgi:HD-GYP domain-containing protein (c-di-GMP phosphodiesterase class II)
MLPIHPSESEKRDWAGATLGFESINNRNILIPFEVDNSNFVTGFIALDNNGFPEGGQNTLFDYASSSFREGHTSLTIHRELGNPTLEDGYTIALLKLAYSIDHCNDFSRNHVIKTAFWARHIARKLGFTEKEADQIELASMLHDIGKVVVPKSVLTKPTKLSEQEWMVMRRHPTYGGLIMRPSSRLHALIPFVTAHHEKFDGSGYPMGMSGEEIPIQARIISISDSYATITDGRVYQPAASKAVALAELKRCSGKQFDPKIIPVMIDLATSDKVDDSQCRWASIGNETFSVNRRYAPRW